MPVGAPEDWLTGEAHLDRSRYLIQNVAGAVLGFLSIETEPQPSPQGDLLHVRIDSDAPQRHVEMWIFAATSKPYRIVKVGSGQRT